MYPGAHVETTPDKPASILVSIGTAGPAGTANPTRTFAELDGGALGATEGHADYDSVVASCPAAPLADRDAGTDMLYSSGTTGRPKGIIHHQPLGPVETHATSVETLVRSVFEATSEAST